MDDFQFSFTWNDTDYTAQAHVEGETQRQTFHVTVDDADLQAQFGQEMIFTWINQITFTWDNPDTDQASVYMRAVNLGLMEYLDEQEEATE
jgi:hypothetical protein